VTAPALRLDADAAAAAAGVLTLGLTAITALAGPLSAVPENPDTVRAGLGLALGVTVLGSLLAVKQSGSLIPAVCALGVAGVVAGAYVTRHRAALEVDA
jgi:hypothetical protein